MPQVLVIRPDDRNAVRHRFDQSSGGLHGDRCAVGQGMQQLVAAKAGGAACRKQDPCDLSHLRCRYRFESP